MLIPPKKFTPGQAVTPIDRFGLPNRNSTHVIPADIYHISFYVEFGHPYGGPLNHGRPVWWVVLKEFPSRKVDEESLSPVISDGALAKLLAETVKA